MFYPGDLQETGHLHSLYIGKINFSSSDYYIVTGIDSFLNLSIPKLIVILSLNLLTIFIIDASSNIDAS